MSNFKCEIVELEILEHSNADALEIAKIKGTDYQCIVRKDQFETGDQVAYIPEQAVLPDSLIEELGLTGKLAGSQKNRVKAVKLRGVLSQGLVYPIPENRGPYSLGTDVTEVLGVTKYEPPIPIHLSGEVTSLFGKTLKFDIENIKNYPHLVEQFSEGVITEKLHGTWCCFGAWLGLDNPELMDGCIFATSKGLSGQGLVFKDNEKNKDNLYMKTLKATKVDSFNVMQRIVKSINEEFGDVEEFEGIGVYLLGEIFGKGVQDLHYGNQTPIFRLFDVYVGSPTKGRFYNPDEVREIANRYNLEYVPVLYEGPITMNIIKEYTDGKDTISNSHVREGIVIRPKIEKRTDEISRLILKSVSEKYLTRKGGTEYN